MDTTTMRLVVLAMTKLTVTMFHKIGRKMTLQFVIEHEIEHDDDAYDIGLEDAKLQLAYGEGFGALPAKRF